MTPREFDAWFDGYLEGIGGDPTAAQSARIREMLMKVDPFDSALQVMLDARKITRGTIYAHVGVQA